MCSIILVVVGMMMPMNVMFINFFIRNIYNSSGSKKDYKDTYV